MATGNCRNCGRPVWNDEPYCSRPCEEEDFEARGGCIGILTYHVAYFTVLALGYGVLGGLLLLLLLALGVAAWVFL